MPHWIVHGIADAVLYGVLWLCGFEPSVGVLGMLLVSNLIDIDHLFARPVYDPRRNSIGFHLLHKKRLIPAYVLGCFALGIWKFFFIGVLLHLLLDFIEFRYLIKRKK